MSEGPTGIARFAYDAADDEDTRRKKQAIFVVAGGCCGAGLVWTAMYAAIFGLGLTTALPAAFVVIVGSALAISHARKDHTIAVYAQIFCIMYVTAFIQWSIGEVLASGFVLVWSFVGPITALVFFPMRRALIWFGLYLVNLAITIVFDGTFRRHGVSVPEGTRILFFAMNLSVSTLVVFFFASYFAHSAASERQRVHELEESLEEARQLGPYTLEDRLGAGGMGVVYRARHALLRRPTAVKMLPVDQVGEQSLARFEREVQLTATLSHPNIIAIHDYGRSTDGTFYYAMELVDGIDLETLVAVHGPLSPSRAIHLLTQICSALEEAHHAGLVHRDIKPANIMLCQQGNRCDVVKVLDFGLVKDLAADEKVTRDDIISGTPAYIAPESVTDPKLIGPRTDIYAVGAVAYWLLTGRTVFRGKTVVEVFAHHVHSQPDRPSRHAEQIPEELDDLVLECLAKTPSARPTTAKALRRRLAEVPLEQRWTEEAAQRWWRDNDANVANDAGPHSGTGRTLQVDLRGRDALPADPQKTVA